MLYSVWFLFGSWLWIIKQKKSGIMIQTIHPVEKRYSQAFSFSFPTKYLINDLHKGWLWVFYRMSRKRWDGFESWDLILVPFVPMKVKLTYTCLHKSLIQSWHNFRSDIDLCDEHTGQASLSYSVLLCILLWQRVTEVQNTVKLTDRMWARLLASTNQPSFLQSDEAVQKVVDKETARLIDNLRITSI